MRQQIELKAAPNGDISRRENGIRTLIEEQVERLERKLKSLSPDEVSLRVVVEETPAHKIYRVSVTLDVPEKVIAAKEENHELEVAIRQAFAEIDSQVEPWKSSRRGEHFWKRLARRDELRNRKISAALEDLDDREGFLSLVSPYLDRLTEFVRHAFNYAQARGDLPRGALTPEDIVDDTLVRAYNEFLKRPKVKHVGSWLVDLAGKQLEGEIKRFRRDAERAVHIEEDVPETPPAEEVSTLGEEIFDFYQPDAALKVEDVVPDLQVPSPEDEAKTNELRECVRTALQALPYEWQKLLLLRYVEDMTLLEVANRVGKTEEEVDRIIEYARYYLRQELMEAGCVFKPRAQAEHVR